MKPLYTGWRDVTSGNPNAGMNYAIQGSKLQSQALNPLMKVLDDYRTIQQANQQALMNQNTGSIMDQIFQGKQITPTGLYDAAKVAEARKAYLDSKALQESRAARTGIARDRNAIARERFNWDKKQDSVPVYIPTIDFGTDTKNQPVNTPAKTKTVSIDNTVEQTLGSGSNPGQDMLLSAIARNESVRSGGVPDTLTPATGTSVDTSTPGLDESRGPRIASAGEAQPYMLPQDMLPQGSRSVEMNPIDIAIAKRMTQADIANEMPVGYGNRSMPVASARNQPYTATQPSSTGKQQPIPVQTGRTAVGSGSRNTDEGYNWDKSSIPQDSPYYGLKMDPKILTGIDRAYKRQKLVDDLYKSKISSLESSYNKDIAPYRKLTGRKAQAQVDKINRLYSDRLKRLESQREKELKPTNREKIVFKLADKYAMENYSPSADTGTRLKSFNITDPGTGQQVQQYLPVDESTGEIASGKYAGKTSPGSKEPTLIQADKKALDTLGTMNRAFLGMKDLTENSEDLFGPIASWFDRSNPDSRLSLISGIGQLFGTDDSKAASLFDKDMSLLKSTVIKSMGANPSDRDLKAIETMLPSRTDEPDVAMKKLNDFREWSFDKQVNTVNRLLRTNPSVAKGYIMDESGNVRKGLVPGYELVRDNGVYKYIKRSK